MRAATVSKFWNFISTLALMPVVLRGVFNREWRSSLAERFVCDKGASFKFGDGPVWLHAASVGEVRGASPVINALKKDYPELSLFITTTSLTGKAEAQKLAGQWPVRLLPYDHPIFVRKLFNNIKPRLLLIAETELWPSFLFEAERQSVPIVLFNGRISDRSFPRYRLLRSFLQTMLAVFSKILVQSKQDYNRFIELGAPPEKVVLSGSTKYEQNSTLLTVTEREALATNLGLSLKLPCLIAGSVRPVEDEIIIRAYKELLRDFPDLQLVLAPRHPECFAKVAAKLTSSNIAFVRRSEITSLINTKVLLLDTIGELTKVYSLATVAFIGGTLVKIGGHNPLEPAAYKVPVILGPNYANVREIVEEMFAAGAAFQVEDERSVVAALKALFGNAAECERAANSAYNVWLAQQGATKRVMKAVQEALNYSEFNLSRMQKLP